ncbi:MAG: putative zinc-binding peptidase [Acetobacteraceae bacterium]|nr:putative zinc-binding peptidase [Acetobacteraceae bacterium]
MKLFKCQSCGQVLFFENRLCGRCGHRLGFLPTLGDLSALEHGRGGDWHPLAAALGSAWRFCANAEHDVCNWMVPAGSADRFCKACRHNRTVPDLSVPGNLAAWHKMEEAKHRLFYTLLRLHLPTPNRIDDSEHGLVFDFLADPATPDGAKVMTGHDEGLITLAVAEADDPQREARRTAMGEPYRTLLGHFRHEIGHFYWNLLVRDAGQLEACRAVFGDDREDYGDALKRHYAQGAPANWQDSYVSMYATTHAWEDFAETWAHYLHIVDSLETASAFGLEVHPAIDPDEVLHAESKVDPYQEERFERLAEVWMPLTIALNAMNRSMGLGDLYPFVLSPTVIRKLSFIHDLVHARAKAS